MPTRRILFVELVEVTSEGDYPVVSHAIRTDRRAFTGMPVADRGVVAALAMQLAHTVVIDAGAFYETLLPPYFEIEWAIQRIEDEGVEPKSLQQRAIDLETLVRAARAGLEPQGGRT